MNTTVMIVDDELFYRQLLGEILAKEGFTVVAQASNGSEAVEKYKIHVPMITIMDIFMPETNGIEALREIMAFDGNARVLICSGMGFEEDLTAALDAGARGVIYKPFMRDEVMASIDGALA